MNLEEKIFHFLRGNWTFYRLTNGQGEMWGKAYFTDFLEDFPRLQYKEAGTFVTPQKVQIPFYQNYIYILRNNKIKVYFNSLQKKEDLFYILEFYDGNKAFGDHVCGNDKYQATYTFLNENQFTLQYKVVGPRKNYLIETNFQRQLAYS